MTESQVRRIITHAFVLFLVLLVEMGAMSVLQMNHTDKAVAELKAECRKP